MRKMSVFDRSFGQDPTGCGGCQNGMDSCRRNFNQEYYNHHHHHSTSPELLTKSDQQKKKEVDEMLSQALSKLTFEERQEQQEASHGVDTKKLAYEATIIETALHDLNVRLRHIRHNTVYEKAERMNPHYVSSRPFRVMFLRGNDYHVRETADQMLRFFEMKEELFGASKLVKDITWDDLDEDDLHCVQTGCMQLIGKDASNRHIIFYLPSLRSFKTIQNEMRMSYFLYMQALKSEEAQLRGCIILLYTVGEFRDALKGGGYMGQFRLERSLPLRRAGVHVCCDDAREVVFLSFVLKNTQPKVRDCSIRQQHPWIQNVKKLKG